MLPNVIDPTIGSRVFAEVSVASCPASRLSAYPCQNNTATGGAFPED
jgi:hypothetical protein